MNEDETQNNEITQTEVEYSIKKHFFTVTPFSKYLAMVLFIVLPLVGLLIGYSFGSASVNVSSTEIDAGTEVMLPQSVADLPGGGMCSTLKSRKAAEREKLKTIPVTELERSNDETDYNGWKEYKNDDLGFSFLYPPEADVVLKDDWFGLHLTSDTLFKIILPSIWVTENASNSGAAATLEGMTHVYSKNIKTLTVDGMPAILKCEEQCHYRVITKEYIFSISGFFLNTIKFNEDVVGTREVAVNWPDEVSRELPDNSPADIMEIGVGGRFYFEEPYIFEGEWVDTTFSKYNVEMCGDHDYEIRGYLPGGIVLLEANSNPVHKLYEFDTNTQTLTFSDRFGSQRTHNWFTYIGMAGKYHVVTETDTPGTDGLALINLYHDETDEIITVATFVWAEIQPSSIEISEDGQSIFFERGKEDLGGSGVYEFEIENQFLTKIQDKD